MDNYATHKTPEIHEYLLRDSRFQLHFTGQLLLAQACRALVRRSDTRGLFQGFLRARYVPSRVSCLSVVEDVIVDPAIEKLQTWLSRGG